VWASSRRRFIGRDIWPEIGGNFHSRARHRGSPLLGCQTHFGVIPDVAAIVSKSRPMCNRFLDHYGLLIKKCRNETQAGLILGLRWPSPTARHNQPMAWQRLGAVISGGFDCLLFSDVHRCFQKAWRVDEPLDKWADGSLT